MESLGGHSYIVFYDLWCSLLVRYVPRANLHFYSLNSPDRLGQENIAHMAK